MLYRRPTVNLWVALRVANQNTAFVFDFQNVGKR